MRLLSLLTLLLLLSPAAAQGGGRDYMLLPISLALVILYLLTLGLVRAGALSVARQKAFWNFVLLISFLISGGLGILLVLRINYGLALSLPFSQLRLHVVSGIVMAVVSVFHVVWHLPYFRAALKR